jgi:hypothetical protein
MIVNLLKPVILLEQLLGGASEAATTPSQTAE